MASALRVVLDTNVLLSGLAGLEGQA